MIGKIALSIAENLFGDAITEQKERLTSAAKNVINDGIEGILTGTRTIEEWAEIAIKGVDKIIKQKKQENLRFVDGFLCFEISEKSPKNVVISFQLYFLDNDDSWQKVEGSSDVLTSNFTDDAIEEMKSKGQIKFSVEG